MPINTAKVRGRRTLVFTSYEEMLAEVHRLAAVPTRSLGNWTLGQTCQHLASAMHLSIIGSPLTAPWFIRLAGPLLKKRILVRMTPGIQLPQQAAAVLLPGPTTTEAGLDSLQQAIERLRRDPARQPHFVLGKLTRDEWDAFHLRHAELHLSFIEPA